MKIITALGAILVFGVPAFGRQAEPTPKPDTEIHVQAQPQAGPQAQPQLPHAQTIPNWNPANGAPVEPIPSAPAHADVQPIPNWSVPVTDAYSTSATMVVLGRVDVHLPVDQRESCLLALGPGLDRRQRAKFARSCMKKK